jgi:hypothetical protein
MNRYLRSRLTISKSRKRNEMRKKLEHLIRMNCLEEEGYDKNVKSILQKMVDTRTGRIDLIYRHLQLLWEEKKIHADPSLYGKDSFVEFFSECPSSVTGRHVISTNSTDKVCFYCGEEI